MMLQMVLLLAIAAAFTYWVLQLSASSALDEELVAVGSSDVAVRTQPLNTPFGTNTFGHNIGQSPR